MEIKLEFIQGEEREGYYIQPLIKRIWAVQLDMLKKINAICKHYQINYYGWFGTLLGAVRHHGFIPWDDDLDLAMLRKDYERFHSLMKTELPDGWEIIEHEPTLICLFNTDKIRLDHDFLNQSHGCPYKCGIDIFCLDRIPQNNADEKIQVNLCHIAHTLCLNWDIPENDIQWADKSKWEYLEEIEQLSGYRFDRQRPIKEQLYFLGDRIAAMYYDVESNIITNVPWLYTDPHYRIPRTCFDKVIEIPFENTVLPVLEDYDLLCKLSYGDNYMTPVKEYQHDYLKKQIEYLREIFKKRGEELPKTFDMTFE